MPKLIIIRGNSGSGKTTIAKELQRRLGRNTMIISQDVVRRDMLWVKDKEGNEAVELMINLLRYGRQHSEVVILEGILYSNIYKALFQAAVEEYGLEIYAYYYDLPFKETVARHQTKDKKFEFGEEEMRAWWRERDYIGLIEEKNLTEELSLEETVDLIVTDVSKKNSPQFLLNKDSLCIGVDGCRNGWIAAVLERGELRIEKFNVIDDIVDKYKEFTEFLIDMVIGLPSNDSYIRPDTTARKLIPGRTSTIFAVPSRQAVYANSELEQIRENKKALGKGLAKQTMAIIPKMREIDVFLNKNQEYKNVIKESHPEVCFSRLNGEVVMSKKSERDGMIERIQILNKFLPWLTSSYVLQMSKLHRCNVDDIVDAICLAVTGNLYAQGKGECIPESPMEDECGLMMRMIIPLK